MALLFFGSGFQNMIAMISAGFQAISGILLKSDIDFTNLRHFLGPCLSRSVLKDFTFITWTTQGHQ